ncbi:MAG: cobaltochelatase subunit CobN [Thermoguttaceae bacterium]|nr:cobaltochelatase subunit CobN [Thermoguttaceae bacterium]
MTLVLTGVLFWGGQKIWKRYFRPFHVAMIGFFDSDYLVWRDAAAQTPYVLKSFTRENVDSLPLEDYDVIVLRTIGWNPKETQRERLRTYGESGGTMVTWPPQSDVAASLQNISPNQWTTCSAYMSNQNVENIHAFLIYLAREFHHETSETPPPVPLPEDGYFYTGDVIEPSWERFRARLDHESTVRDPCAPTVAFFGPFLNPMKILDRRPVDELIARLEKAGCRVCPIYGFKNCPELLEQCHPDIAIYFPLGRTLAGDAGAKLLEKLDVPCLSAISLSCTEKQWRSEPLGMTGSYHNLAIALPELDGVIEPTAIATRDSDATDDSQTDSDETETPRLRRILSERMNLLVARVQRWIQLQRKPNAQKRLAIFYYKAPGQSALTAQSLDVIPSLYQTLIRLRQEGYDLGPDFPPSAEALEQRIMREGRTIGQWAIGAFEDFVKDGNPEKIPAALYGDWFQRAIPKDAQQEVIRLWGLIPGKYMSIQENESSSLLVSRIVFGNVVILPQPTTDIITEEPLLASDDVKSVHGTNRAPPHFYIGAYLWVHYGFQADAMIHFGTHGSLEFTRGKSAVLSENCWPSILTGDLPHIYLYSINNIGEALLAKRRTQAVLISHLTPPFRPGGLYGDLAVLDEKIHDYESSELPELREELRKTITQLAKNTRLSAPSEGSEAVPLSDSQIQILSEEIERLRDTQITEGLHVIGRKWTDEQVSDTSNAMPGDPEENARHLRISFDQEPSRLIHALNGRFIPPSSGGDPIVNPDSVPTGRNPAGLNMEQTPSQEAYAIAVRLTDEILSEYRKNHAGNYPQRVACTLWGGEYLRTQGVNVSQVLRLLGVKPVRNSRNSIQELEIIPSETLGRPRIDVLIQTSGQFRDAVGSRIELIDKAVRMVSELPDELYPNYVRAHTELIRESLETSKFSADEARELSTARIFGSPGALSYGTGMMRLIERGDQWKNSTQIADQYLVNMSGIYRNGHVWGEPVAGLLERNLTGTELCLQTRSSNTWGPVKLDHIYEFSTLALAVREKTGVDPAIWFSDLRRPGQARNQTAAQAIRDELRTTLWNPKYIQALQKESASGAETFGKTVNNLYGWNVVQPSTVDPSLWDETYQVLVEDRYQLGMRAYFEQKNPAVLQKITAAMLETIRKGLWRPSEEVVQHLAELHAEQIVTYGAACSYEVCANTELRQFLGTHLPSEIADKYTHAVNRVIHSSVPLPEVQGMQLREKESIPEEASVTEPPTEPQREWTSYLLTVLLLPLCGGFFLGSSDRR